MKLTISSDADLPTVVTLSGEVDLATAGELESALADLVAAGTTHLVVDLQEVSFCDSVGLNALVRIRNRCEAHGGWMRISHARGEVAAVLRISGLEDHLSADEVQPG